MSMIKKCDICGTTYTPYGWLEGRNGSSRKRRDPKNANGFSFLTIGNCDCGSAAPYFALKPRDTCTVCRDKIKAFIDSLIEEATNPPETEPPTEPIEPPTEEGEGADGQ